MSEQNKKKKIGSPTKDDSGRIISKDLEELRLIRNLLKQALSENIKRNLELIFKAKNYDDIIDEKLNQINELMLNEEDSVEKLYVINGLIEEIKRINNNSKRLK